MDALTMIMLASCGIFAALLVAFFRKPGFSPVQRATFVVFALGCFVVVIWQSQRARDVLASNEAQKEQVSRLFQECMRQIPTGGERKACVELEHLAGGKPTATP